MIELTTAALSRTILLIRDVIGPEVPDATIVAALTNTRITVVADRRNLGCAEGQHALVTTSLLAARSGARVQVRMDDTPLLGSQPPLIGDRLLPSLYECLADLIPGVPPVLIEDHIDSDLIILIGDTAVPKSATYRRAIRVQGDAWRGEIVSCYQSGGERWRPCSSPLGALAGAGLAATESFKCSMAPLRRKATDTVLFDERFAFAKHASVRLAPSGAPLPRKVSTRLDAVSGGAIIQAALYCLARVPSTSWLLRLIEPESYDVTNLNRYALLRASRLGLSKAIDVALQASAGRLGEFSVNAEPVRFDTHFLSEHGKKLSPYVIVGVDDIPTRWLVQAQWPQWLGVGATTHWSAMVTTHTPSDIACAGCAHPYRDDTQGAIPTVSFVSHWAGLCLAARLILTLAGVHVPETEQSIFMSPLRFDKAGLWISASARHPNCPIHIAA
jgi:hypothetical protein